LLLLVGILTVLCILAPLMMKRRRKSNSKTTYPLVLYFLSIGFGFMLIEISQMQRLIIFLGHPSYGLSVVLFTLLLAGGIGSFLVSGASGSHSSGGKIRLTALILLLLMAGASTPILAQLFQASSTPLRVLVSVFLLFIPGLFMGMAFPLGMIAAASETDSIKSWLWGINGATSVFASVLAMVISLTYGISVTFWCGVSFYLLALLALKITTKAQRPLRITN
jgi:hypothetical protein